MHRPAPIVEGPMSGRRRRLQWWGGVASSISALALLALAGIALRSVAVSHRTATDAARVDLLALEDAGEMQALLYQKGFAAEYFLTGDERWINELDRTRPAFERWLANVTKNAG